MFWEVSIFINDIMECMLFIGVSFFIRHAMGCAMSSFINTSRRGHTLLAIRYPKKDSGVLFAFSMKRLLKKQKQMANL